MCVKLTYGWHIGSAGNKTDQSEGTVRFVIEHRTSDRDRCRISLSDIEDKGECMIG